MQLQIHLTSQLTRSSMDNSNLQNQEKHLKLLNPATGKVIAQVAACNADDVDHAVIKAREAFDQGHWSKIHPSERKKTLIKLSKLIKRNLNELAVMESVDSGKPVSRLCYD